MTAAGDKEAAEVAASKLSKWQSVQKDFIKQTGLKRQHDREGVAGFGGSEAAKARASGMIPEKVLRFNKAHAAQTDAERLPGYSKAEIPDSKITEYALNINHPDGKNKAIAFEKYLGYNINNKDQLLKQVQKGLQRYRAKPRNPNKYGKPYEVAMMVFGANRNFSKVKTGWIIEYGTDIPRLTSIYVDE